MELTRLKRYNEKISLIKKRKKEFYEWLPNFFDDEKTKLACLKAMQEIIEAATGVISMMLTDEKIIPKDDYTNITCAATNKLINKNIEKDLIELNGLRNRIIHKYNSLSDKIVVDSFRMLEKSLVKFEENFEIWLESKNSKKN